MSACPFNINQAATIRGVPFHIETGQESGGHRKIDHAYPNRDEHYFEDLGWKSDYFDIRGYISDLDASASQVRAIRDALKGKGECSFYHPILNEMFQVEVFDWSIDTKKVQLGRVDFSFKAAKVASGGAGGGASVSPVATASPGAALSAAAGGIGAAMAGHLA